MSNKSSDTESLPSGHWSHHARQWSYIGSPLRPCPEDIDINLEVVKKWTQKTGRNTPTVVVMGVTPELCKLAIDTGSRFIAVDNSADMIKAIWPGAIRPRDEVICADWRHIPLDKASVDIVLADGGLSALPYPLAYSDLCTEARRILCHDGLFIVRCFVHPDKQETLDDVFSDLEQKRIGNFHVLKWRLVMALQPNAKEGVAVGNVWKALHDFCKDFDKLAERFGWPIEEVRTINAYHNVETRYSFPTLAEYKGVFSSAGFSVNKVITPSYELGDRCPTLVLE